MGNCFRCILHFLTVDLQSCFNAVLPYSPAEGYMQNISMPFFSFRVLVPWICTRHHQKIKEAQPGGEERGPLEPEPHFFCAPDEYLPVHTGVFYIFWKSGLWRAFRVLHITQWFWAHRSRWVAKVMGKAGGENQSSVPIALISHCPMESIWGNATTVWSSLIHLYP